jgi:hypothetical protein
VSIKSDIKQALGDEFAYALDDIRQKVVEQGAWGQIATPEITRPLETPSPMSTAEWLGLETPEGTKKDVSQEMERSPSSTAEWLGLSPARKQESLTQEPEREPDISR